MKQLNFTFNQILDEIKRLSTVDPEGFTVTEMSESMDRSKRWCRVKLQHLIIEEKVRHNGWAHRTRIDGKPCRVPVYIHVGEGEGTA